VDSFKRGNERYIVAADFCEHGNERIGASGGFLKMLMKVGTSRRLF
jgi:hypothetical protein